MRRWLPLTLGLSLIACEGPPPAPPAGPPAGAEKLTFPHTRTFEVFARGGYHIVDFDAPVVTWGGEAQGANQTARVVLVPRDREAPPLTGDLAGATLVRTPVERIAVNYGPLEAMLSALGVADRLVAVGGLKSYDDTIRARAQAGELAQIGYGWHMPPMIDPLLGAEPDVFLMSLGDLGHAEHYERILDLGVPVIPIFSESEPHYLGPVDYVRLVGLLTGRDEAAEAFVREVEREVERLKGLAAEQPPKRVLSAWFAGRGAWTVTVRNREQALLEDANGINPLRQPDDIRLAPTERLGTEVLLTRARDVDCWLIRDTHSQPFDDVGVLRQFEAWREGCLFASDGRSKPEADAFDFYETGVIRPDLLLADTIRMLHPALRTEPFVYIRPDERTPRP